jgi:hypothetical protein
LSKLCTISHGLIKVACTLFLATLLVAGSANFKSNSNSKTSSVNVHGVNYAGGEFSYVVVDAANKNNQAGGELINPYSAGGTICCYELPNKWRPDIKIRIATSRWLPKTPDGVLPEVQQETVVNVPPYVDGKPGELWIIRDAHGLMSVVSSDYQPDHAKWPGTTRGWPVPSIEYRREVWDRSIEHVESMVRVARNILRDLETSPEKRALESWNFKWKNAETFSEGSESQSTAADMARSDRELLSRFSGPEDPKFLLWLRQDDQEFLRKNEEELEDLRTNRP